MTKNGGRKALGARLKLVREGLGYTQADMAKFVGVSLRTYSRYENDERDIYPAPIPFLIEHGFSADWLLFGRGEMRIRETSLPVVEAPSATQAAIFTQVQMPARFAAIRAHFSAAERREISQREMATRTGVAKNTWQRYEAGDLPSTQLLLSLAAMGINVHWLLTGIGEMRIDEEAPFKPQGLSEDWLRKVGAAYGVGPYAPAHPAAQPVQPILDDDLTTLGLMRSAAEGRRRMRERLAARRQPLSRIFDFILFLLGFRKVDGVLDRAAAMDAARKRQRRAISDEHALFEKGLNQAKPMPDAHLEAVRTVVEDSLVRNISHHSPARQLRDERGCDE